MTDGTDPSLDDDYRAAIKETIARFEETGSPVITDGEQRKYHNFWTYSVEGSPNIVPNGFRIPFASGHVRRMPRLKAGPFRYRRSAADYLAEALRYSSRPVKQAVISPSALSLIYPDVDLPSYSREEFLDDLLSESETEIRRCLALGAHAVQIDFTEGRFALKVDPTGKLLHNFIDLNNVLLSRFTTEERRRIGVHTCPGGDRDSTHSADVDYSELLPSLMALDVTNFYISMSGEKDRQKALELIRIHLRPHHRVFIGVTAPIDPRIETAKEVADQLIAASRFIPADQLGSTDDCGFAPFCDDLSTTRDTAFEKIRVRVEGTRVAERMIGGG